MMLEANHDTSHEGEHEVDNLPDFKLPDVCFCPISKKLMVDPVTLNEVAYEREALAQWLQNHDTDPQGGALPNPMPTLKTNVIAKAIIDSFITQYPALKAQRYVSKQQQADQRWLTSAAEGASKQALQALLQGTPSVHPLSQDPQGNTALHQALAYGHWPTVQALYELLSPPVDVSSEDEEKQTITDIEMPTQNRWQSLLTLTNHQGQGPFHMIAHQISAQQQAISEPVGFFLDQGVDINSQDHQGQTALHVLLLRQRPAAALILVQHGADCNRLNQDNESPLAYTDSGTVQKLNAAHNDYLKKGMAQLRTEQQTLHHNMQLLNERDQVLTEQLKTAETSCAILTEQLRN